MVLPYINMIFKYRKRHTWCQENSGHCFTVGKCGEYWEHLRAAAAAAAAKLLQSCPTLCDPIDGLLPGFSVPGILQARTLEWAAISFSNAWKWKVKVKSLSRVRLLATPWTAAHQAPQSTDFPGKSNGVGCHCLLCKSWIAIFISYKIGFKTLTIIKEHYIIIKGSIQ